jgi:hypothetical protein
VVIELPNAAGQLEHFRVIETPIMEPALAIKYPMIKSYAAQGIDDPTAVARFSVTQFGLHSMTLSAQKAHTLTLTRPIPKIILCMTGLH